MRLMAEYRRRNARHAVEPNGSNPDRARAHIQRRLMVAAELERAAASEVDRLSAIAAGQGWTDYELSDLLKLDDFHRKRPGRKPQEQAQ